MPTEPDDDSLLDDVRAMAHDAGLRAREYELDPNAILRVLNKDHFRRKSPARYLAFVGAVAAAATVVALPLTVLHKNNDARPTTSAATSSSPTSTSRPTTSPLGPAPSGLQQLVDDSERILRVAPKAGRPGVYTVIESLKGSVSKGSIVHVQDQPRGKTERLIFLSRSGNLLGDFVRSKGDNFVSLDQRLAADTRTVDLSTLRSDVNPDENR